MSLENDAAAVNSSCVASRSTSSNDGAVGVCNENTAVVTNNTLVTNQTQVTNINIANSNGVHIGNSYTIELPRFQNQAAGPRALGYSITKEQQKDIFKRSKTIDEMIKSQEPLNEILLYMFCQNFGWRHEEIVILLKIDKLLYERMFSDNSKIGGTGEVIYQVLYDYFRQNDARATLGWFTDFLWYNGFRESVYNVKERYKQYKKLLNEED